MSEKLKEIIGDALIVALGILVIYVFVCIEILGYYGMEQNSIIRWIELVMGIPIIIIGIERMVEDAKK